MALDNGYILWEFVDHVHPYTPNIANWNITYS